MLTVKDLSQHPLVMKAQEEGDAAVGILRCIRSRTGGWFDCECGSCVLHGDDFHAWEAFHDRAAAAAHFACLHLAEIDFNVATKSPPPTPDVERQDDPAEIVGHKTFVTGRVSASGFPELRHEPLTRAEAQALVAHVEQERERRAREMPDERAAILRMFDGYARLKELGWREAVYCPKDGSVFEAIEAGSTGIHECSYNGEWPTGSWFVHADGDLWPSRPILFRLRGVGDTPTPGGEQP